MRRGSRKFVVAIAAAIGLACVLLPAIPAGAVAISVNRFDDPDPDGCSTNGCSLREAVIAANAADGPDSITLKKGTYLLDRSNSASGNTDTNATVGDIDITDDLTIKGVSGWGTRIFAADAATLVPSGHFEVSEDAGEVLFQKLTLLGGGWGIWNGGPDTILDQVVVRGARGRGGLLNIGDQAALEVKKSTIGPSNVHSLGLGGGIHNAGDLSVSDTLIYNNTSSGVTLGGGKGGGLFNQAGDAVLNNVTIFSNSSAFGTGDSIFRNDGTVTTSNSYIGSGCAATSAKAVTTSLGYNYFQNSADVCVQDAGPGDQESQAAPGLAPLRYRGYGGPPSYFEPSADSLLIDAGDPTAGNCSASDQRGVSRPKDGSDKDTDPECDIGAVEFVDDTGPPSVSLSKPSTPQTTNTSVPVAWSGSDPLSGIESFDVFYRFRKLNKTYGAKKLWKENVPAGAATFAAKRGFQYCFSAKALDRDGNESGFSAEKCTKVVQP